MSTIPVNMGPYCEAGLWIIDADADGWEIYVAEGTLNAGSYYRSGSSDIISYPYDPVAQRYLRIRHTSVGNQIVFETSADDENWTVLRSMARDTSINYFTMHFMLYSYVATRSEPLLNQPFARFNHIKTNAPIVLIIE